MVAATAAFSDDPQTGWQRTTTEASEEFLKKLEKANSAKDYWYKNYDEASTKLSAYENLQNSNIEINYEGDTGAKAVSFTGEQIIRQFAVGLSGGLKREQISDGLYEALQHKYDSSTAKIKPNSIASVELFFEVFKIAEQVTGVGLRIRENKKWLLKAAFLPLKTTVEQFNDEIPF